MDIIGGTYVERCREPEYEAVLGSALRAGAALTGVARPRVVTAVDEETRILAEATAEMYRYDLSTICRERPIGFTYQTPLSPPVIDGQTQAECVVPLVRSEGPVLVFGMLEAVPEAEAPYIVYDPQRPRGPLAADRSRLRSGHFAIVANVAEIIALGGKGPLEEVAARVAADASADVVVVKRGALGALVFERRGMTTHIGPWATEHVWPVGSGDVFSAVFTWAWAEEKCAPVEAARLASAGAAYWCGSQTLPLPLRELQVGAIAPGRQLLPATERVPVYLAGPFFNLGQRWLVELARQALSQVGGQVFSPLHDVGRGGDEVAKRDLQGLEGAKGVLGLLDEGDPGTLFELGWAAAKGIPCSGYAEHPRSDHYKMLRGVGINVTGDFSTAVYWAIWSGMDLA